MLFLWDTARLSGNLTKKISQRSDTLKSYQRDIAPPKGTHAQEGPFSLAGMTNILEDGATADRDDHIMVEGVGEHNDAATEDDSGDETQHSSSNQKNVSQRRRTQNAKFED